MGTVANITVSTRMVSHRNSLGLAIVAAAAAVEAAVLARRAVTKPNLQGSNGTHFTNLEAVCEVSKSNRYFCNPRLSEVSELQNRRY